MIARRFSIPLFGFAIALIALGAEADSSAPVVEPAVAAADSRDAEREELRRLLAEMRSPVRPVEARFELQDQPTLGRDTAPLVLIEFGEFQCPFCRRHIETVMPALVREYVETGKLLYVFADFPAKPEHEQAPGAARAARCAAEQDSYWQMRQHLFANFRALDPSFLPGHAEALSLDLAAFNECFETGRYTEEVKSDLSTGTSLQVRGTPTFFLGTKVPDSSQIVLSRRITGAQPLELFVREIDGYLGDLAKSEAASTLARKSGNSGD